jgi:hypothetical protein
MTLLSLTAYAKSHGASRQAAAKWKKAGVLTFSGEMVDVAASDAAMRDAGLGRFKGEAAEAQPAPATSPRNRAPVAGATTAVAGVVDEVVSDLRAAIDSDEIDEEIAGGFIEQLLAGKFRSKVEAAAIKENALALKHLLAAKKEAGTLAWPGRFAPLLAADLDIDGAQLAEALKPYVHQQLEELGEPDLDFTGTDEG